MALFQSPDLLAGDFPFQPDVLCLPVNSPAELTEVIKFDSFLMRAGSTLSLLPRPPALTSLRFYFVFFLPSYSFEKMISGVVPFSPLPWTLVPSCALTPPSSRLLISHFVSLGFFLPLVFKYFDRASTLLMENSLSSRFRELGPMPVTRTCLVPPPISDPLSVSPQIIVRHLPSSVPEGGGRR